MERFCDRCKCDEAFRNYTGDSCPIVAMSMVCEIDDPDYPHEWIIGDEGLPVCTAFEEE